MIPPRRPVELTAMLPEICERIGDRVGSGTTYIRRLQTFGIGESTIQELVNARSSDWPEGSCSASGLAYRSLN